MTKLFSLKYDSYTYTLDIKSLDISADTNSATVVLIEANKIVFEGLTVASETGGYEHTIYIVKVKGNWLIVEDSYQDEVTQWLDFNHLTKAQAMQIVTQNYQKHKKELKQQTNQANNPMRQPLPLTGHYYNGTLAANWASTHYHDGGAYDFNEHGLSDCANFVSEAIAASGVPQIGNGYPPYSGSAGWYFTNGVVYSESWATASSLIYFIVSLHATWPTGGPDGVGKPNVYYLGLGDVLGWTWDSDGLANHVGIVTLVNYGSGDWRFTDRTAITPWSPVEYHYNVPFTFWAPYSHGNWYIDVNGY